LARDAREAGLYRYATEADSRRGESPLDHDDHTMDALRYLIASIDERKLGRRRRIDGAAAGEKPKERKWLSLYNEALWTPVWRVWRQGFSLADRLRTGIMISGGG